jgi:hypothetical protein
MDFLERQLNSKNNSGSTVETGRINFTHKIQKQVFHIDPLSLNSIANQNIKILDFSPEWDYTSGGVKLLV